MKTLRTLLALILAAAGAYLVIVLVVGPLLRPSPEGPHEAPDSVLEDFQQVVGREDILPVYDPTFLPASAAALEPDELVIGVELEGEARAYPVGFLNFREMVNDRIGPVPFLVTW